MSVDSQWLGHYFDQYQKALFPNTVESELLRLHELCLKVRSAGKKLILAGNGASASLASHGAVDFSKQGKVRAVCFNEANLLTAFSNDWGYENWVVKALEIYADPGDVVILISSSGKSPNLVKAGAACAAQGLTLVTFTGFASDNPLKQLGEINFWVESHAYNLIENVHGIWLCTVVDMLVGRSDYGVT
jgi:D-sedoheptulose 7-phosphate isomerase